MRSEATQGRGCSSRLLSWIALVSGCASAPSPPPTRGPPLPAATKGCYAITRAERHVGVERFEIESAPDRWRARGAIRLVAPVPETMRYDFVLDPRDGALVGFRFSVEVEGVVASAVGVRERESVRIETDVAGSRSGTVVPFAFGSYLLLPTPVLDAVAFGKESAGEGPVEIRALTVSVPWLEATVERVAIRERGREGALRVMELGAGSGRAATSWVRADGLAVTAETYAPGGGAPFVMRLAEASSTGSGQASSTGSGQACEDPPEPGTIEVRRPDGERSTMDEAVEPSDPAE
ncbi:MAG: hypothetical protein HYV07_22325 [Deltaproteobacteria bacterium]|nr:hypothetical protein [Deltaproteobacteria bacterium]